MIDYSHALWLALVQGLTEFLPISSSGHLVLAPVVMGWSDQGLAFDVAVHGGSLLAVLAYFRNDLAAMLRALPDAVRLKQDRDASLLRNLLVATLPLVAVGYAAETFVETHLRNPLVIASTTIIFGIVLWLSDRLGARDRSIDSLRWRGALLIGIAQALALVPGTSRSGITISAALLIGLTRTDAARFSFLLSIPAIIAAGTLKGWELVNSSEPVDAGVFAAGFAASAITAYACVAVLLRVIERIGLLPFVIYRLLLGAYLFYVFL